MIDIILVLVVAFFLPGFFLVNALFPRKGELDKDYDLLYRITLGIVMSVVIAILVGFILNAFGVDPQTSKGYFRAEIIWPVIIILAILLFIIGWFRGAYPSMGKIHPSLLRISKREPQSVIVDLKEDKDTLVAFRELSEKRENLRRRLKNYERRVRLQTGEMRKRSESRILEIQKDLETIDEELRIMEEKRAAELY
ncbi:MAG: DUF1616 domain-containing protein [Methanobacteriota archaeon]|nr:MAG: DUF1616 domain-containing protein [Euryarchaeota archaeon]